MAPIRETPTEAKLLGIAMGMKGAGSGVIEFISDFNTPDPESEFEMIDRLLSDDSKGVIDNGNQQIPG
jgi:hypothetical protein